MAGDGWARVSAGSGRVHVDDPIQRAREYASRVGGGTHPWLWQLVDQEVELTDSSNGILRGYWQLDPTSRPHDPAPQRLVPLPSLAVDTLPDSVLVTTMAGCRDALATPSTILDAVAGPASGPGVLTTNPHAAILLTAEEVASLPTVAVATSHRSPPPPRTPWPVASVEFDDLCLTARALSVHLPASATADIVALQVTIDWSSDHDAIGIVLRDYLTNEGAQSSPPERASMARRVLQDLLGDTVEFLRQMSDVLIEDDWIGVRRSARKEAKRRREKAQGEIARLIRAISNLRARSSDLTLLELIEETVALLPILDPDPEVPASASGRSQANGGTGEHQMTDEAEPTSFAVICEVRDGKVDMPWSPEAADRLRIARVGLPFTAERAPTSQTRTTAAGLLLLAGAMLLLAVLSPDWGPLSLEPSNPLDPVDNEALVALLVLFPAILYGQFFQSRPRTPIQRRTQQWTFGVLSFVYALPIIPAALLAIGTVPYQVIAIAIAVSGALALAAGLTILWLFRRQTLRSLRRSRAVWSMLRQEQGPSPSSSGAH